MDEETPASPDRRPPRGFMALPGPALHRESGVTMVRASEVASIAEHTFDVGTRHAREGSMIIMRNGCQVAVFKLLADVAATMNEEGEGRAPLVPPEPDTAPVVEAATPPSRLLYSSCFHAYW